MSIKWTKLTEKNFPRKRSKKWKMGNLSKRYLTLSYWARGSDKKREVSFGRAMVNAVNGDIHTSWILEGFHGERVVTHFSEINIKNGKKKKV